MLVATMLKTTLAGMRLHKLRTLLTGLAVVIGVSFLAGTLIYGDTAKAAFFADLARPGANVDVAVQPSYISAIGSDRRFVDEDALARVAAVPGVAVAEGRWSAPLGMLNRAGRVITNEGYVGKTVSLPGDPRFAMFTVVSGTLPTRDDEAALDKPTATREGLAVGDPITVVDMAKQKHKLTVTAIVDYGASSLFAKFSVVALTAPEIRALTHPAGYSEIVVAATPGTDPQTLRDRIASAVEQRYVVSTGDEFRDNLAEDSAKYVEGFLSVLLASALVALVVACLVVYNTFSILVAQRTRELALLRCVGASRRQIFGMVVVESAVVGAVASLVGVVASLGIGRLMLLGRNSPAAACPTTRSWSRRPRSAPRSSRGRRHERPRRTAPRQEREPGRAAGRAERQPRGGRRACPLPERQAGSPARRGGLRRGLAMAAGTRRGMGFTGTPLVLGGAMMIFVAIVAVLPLVVGRLAGIAGWLPTRLLGVTARLATTNARRNPRRASAITTAS
jgi:putative ABC transport system permease protein